jgi:hypothetical protein
LETRPDDGELVSLGDRLEKLTSERQAVERAQIEAETRFEEIAPKPDPKIRTIGGGPRTPVATVWDVITEETEYPRSDVWKLLARQAGRKGPYSTIEAAAQQSGYSSTVERAIAMDAEIRDLATRALKIEAKGPAGVKAQALAILALGETNTGRLPRVTTNLSIRADGLRRAVRQRRPYGLVGLGGNCNRDHGRTALSPREGGPPSERCDLSARVHKSSSPRVGQILDRSAQVAAKPLILLALPRGLEPLFSP